MRPRTIEAIHVSPGRNNDDLMRPSVCTAGALHDHEGEAYMTHVVAACLRKLA